MTEKALSDYLFSTKSQSKWYRVTAARRSGVLAPLFSVYSKNSAGIADFSDLKLLVDWAQESGNSILQLLPMNETGSISCPYDALSSFAIEPAYMCLDDLPAAKNPSIKAKIESFRKKFSFAGRAHLDYALKTEKLDILWQMYLSWDHSDSLELKNFVQENAYWLKDFALYKALKDFHSGRAWYDWKDEFKFRSPRALENFQLEYSKEIIFQQWLQWKLCLQFKDAFLHAKNRNILLKGDLPILVSRDSSDVWAHPEFFKLEFAAGAPPDMYCAKGQRWGMPTYNWEKIAADKYTYLKEKLKYAENFYDILRIDHVVGLFRIWSIPYNEPLENQGLHGFFDPLEEYKWDSHGRAILSAFLENTNMLLCAEDLGVIPKACTEAIKEFGVPGNDVQRWVKDWKIKHDFLNPSEYRNLSVSMLSTHDTTNFAAWWENEAGTVDDGLFMRKCLDRKIDYSRVRGELFDLALSCRGRLRWKLLVDSVEKLTFILGKRREEVGDFIEIYENTFREKEKLWAHFKISGPMREKADAEIAAAALKIVLSSSSIFCINLITDWLYLSGLLKGDPYHFRINTPGTISARNWSLLMPLALEDLSRHRVTREMREMIAASGRI